MIRTAIVPAAVLLGLLCLAVSQFWPSYAQSQAKQTWTEEKAKKHQEISAELHELSYGPGHSHSGRPRRPTAEQQAQHQAALDQAKREFAASKAELEEEQNAGQAVARFCWLAALCLIGGGIGLFFMAPDGKGK